MNFKVVIRPMSVSDITKECPFPPSDNEYAAALRLLVEDIQNDPFCKSVILGEGKITIDSIFKSKSDMKEGLKKYFSDYFCLIRCDGVELLS